MHFQWFSFAQKFDILICQKWGFVGSLVKQKKRSKGYRNSYQMAIKSIYQKKN